MRAAALGGAARHVLKWPAAAAQVAGAAGRRGEPAAAPPSPSRPPGRGRGRCERRRPGPPGSLPPMPSGPPRGAAAPREAEAALP